MLRIFVSLARKTTSQSIIVSKLSAYARRNKTQRALWEYDAILRSIYLLTYIDSPPMRRHAQHALNRGENSINCAAPCPMPTSASYASRARRTSRSGASAVASSQIAFSISTRRFSRSYLRKKSVSGDSAGVEALKGIALAAWGHVNLHGRFEFTRGPQPIDVAALVQQLAQHPIVPDDAEP